ncbi:SIR2 family protein [Saccharicrinis sp. 156]|uniref:SIR2 family protein n=1 Tax=Saccharicrinis sp. 156 TaxID=3417574 RepID=UPI003D33236D
MNKLQFDEFLRAINISKNDTYSLLLGAGCSITSDIPSAEDCIWEWKKSIYKSNNSTASDWIENHRNPKVKDTIQHWIDNQGGYPERENAEEYSFYAKKCYPIEEHRRQYFQKISSNKKPSIGYKSIPILAKQGILDSVWTTNLDELVVTACSGSGVQSIEITLDSVQRLTSRSQNRNELPVIKLHGDFKYGELKNTVEELQNQDETFRKVLIDYLRDKHLIVVGYSGRDASLMDALKEAYSKPGGGMLYWCGYGSTASKEVQELIELAEKSNRNAFHISTEGFDTVLRKTAQLVVEDNRELKQELINLHQLEEKQDVFTPFDLKPDRTNKIVKSNLYKISFPDEVFVFEATLDEKPWEFVKSRTLTRSDIVAVPYRKQIWCFGNLTVIKDVFSDVIESEVQRKPLANIKIYNSATSSLLLTAVCKVLASTYNIKTNYKNRLWSESDFQTIAGQKVFNAIKLSFDRISGVFYLTLNPDFELEKEDVDRTLAQNVGIAFFHKIWNKQFNIYVEKWRKALFQKINEFEFPIDSGSGFRFKITKAPLFTEVCNLNYRYPQSHTVPKHFFNLKGIQFKEVPLLFSTSNGSRNVTDEHPMRGLVNNKPFETNINSLLSDRVDIALVSPKAEATNLYTFIQKQNQKIAKFKQNDDYIIDFEGFYTTYGVSLNFPTPDSEGWEYVAEPQNTGIVENANYIKQEICNCIVKINSTGRQKIVVIYITQRWEEFTSYNEQGEIFDLHDYIKAFCAEKGIMSQLIREKTVKDQQQSCQINWWLSLSFYVKSLRTPWILANTDKNTAFAGLGYSIDSNDNSNGHIVLGCSHIYSSTGEGLKYKLSKISNNKIQWRHKKPHLCYDDAYEFGRNILNLFYESMNELPKRVVIHKRTFFTGEEKQGILDSLSDNGIIESIDLIEINFEDNIKYTASKIKNNKPEIDGFSVSRGTCIQLNSKEALLWAHGVIPSVRNPNYNFYPGGRYIPKPLRVIKHYGNGSLEQIANEILGLTKMNWNSLNMYSQLPATISSSNDIARIGKLIDSNTYSEYDYRYFI